MNLATHEVSMSSNVPVSHIVAELLANTEKTMAQAEMQTLVDPPGRLTEIVTTDHKCIL